MTTPLVSIPVTLKYLGPEIYSLCATVSSLFGMLIFADPGLGNGLIARLGQAYTTGNLPKCRRLISTVTFLLVGVAGS